MALAVKHGLASIAFPSISTGIYGYPIEQAARIAVTTVKQFLAESESSLDVTFCCFSQPDLEVYQAILDRPS